MAESLHMCKHLRFLIVSLRTAIPTLTTGSFLANDSSLGQAFPMDLPSMAQAQPSMRENRKDSVPGELRLLGRGTMLLLGSIYQGLSLQIPDSPSLAILVHSTNIFFCGASPYTHTHTHHAVMNIPK